jgi:hypothetical protein
VESSENFTFGSEQYAQFWGDDRDRSLLEAVDRDRQRPKDPMIRSVTTLVKAISVSATIRY